MNLIVVLLFALTSACTLLPDRYDEWTKDTKAGDITLEFSNIINPIIDKYSKEFREVSERLMKEVADDEHASNYLDHCYTEYHMFARSSEDQINAIQEKSVAIMSKALLECKPLISNCSDQINQAKGELVKLIDAANSVCQGVKNTTKRTILDIQKMSYESDESRDMNPCNYPLYDSSLIDRLTAA